MCKQCETKPVYEFTNQRKLCVACFTSWFIKKVFYTVRKFGMIKNGDRIGYFKSEHFRAVVLEDVLKMLEKSGRIEIRKIPARLRSQINILDNKKTRGSYTKLALSDTTDIVANEIVEEVIKSVSSAHPPTQKQKSFKIIRPLYLFLDKEVLLYAKLRKLKFAKRDVSAITFSKELPAHLRSQIDIKDNKKSRATLERGKSEINKLSQFLNELETKHPEVKQAIIQGWLRLNKNN